MSSAPARYCCRDEERRAAVAADGNLNGIDFLEVVDQEVLAAGAPESLRQRLLLVVLLRPVPAGFGAVGPDSQPVRLQGGVRRRVGVRWSAALNALPAPVPDVVLAEELDFLQNDLVPPAPAGRVLVVATDSTGDHSPYTLRLVGAADDLPPVGFDGRLSEVCFSFKVECPSPLDCQEEDACPAPTADSDLPEDYLAKDYPSFRRLMLDRLRTLAPEWDERNPADLGVTLVEALAYTADHLSYYQDAAAATEAYLGTARQRISVRRHARLVDYFLDEGANARVWVHVRAAQALALPASTRLLPAAAEGEPAEVQGAVLDSGALLPSVLEATIDAAPAVFETLHAASFEPGHNELLFYSWSDRECCLPAGSTRATLVGARRAAGAVPPYEPVDPALEVGDFLLFEEVLGPHTGAAADADPGHRHVVRLTEVAESVDPLNGQPVLEITWNAEDALPFPLCVSAFTDAEHGARYVEDVSVARGNLVLADHGLTVEAEKVGSGKREEIGPVPSAVDDPAVVHDWPFRPRLDQGPLTHAVPLPDGFPDGETGASAGRGISATRLFSPGQPAEPVLALIEKDSGDPWTPRRDLLGAGRFDRAVVAEIEDPEGGVGVGGGRARLRFGDGEHGQRPRRGQVFQVDYRVGLGTLGNLGAEALARVVTNQPGIAAVRNPLPATGGRAPERKLEARRKAPYAFRVQQRAVTADDYARMAERHPDVARAAATFRWTGSWYTVFVTADRVGGQPVDADFRDQLRAHLEPFRLVGHDLEVDAPRFVPLLLRLFVCLRPGYQRSDVTRELRRVLGRSRLADGRRGFFHPDRWTFGQDVHLSPILAAAAAVNGVASVEPRVFRRLDRRADQELELGVLPVSRLEIARLDHDPNFQEYGRLELNFGGER